MSVRRARGAVAGNPPCCGEAAGIAGSETQRLQVGPGVCGRSVFRQVL